MINSKKLIVLFLILFSLLSCKSPDNSLFHFDPRTLKENEITLSEIADDITYITLDNSFPIGFIYDTFEFLNSSICLSAKDIGILTFNRDGKFLRKIGGIGRGPGEYTYPCPMPQHKFPVSYRCFRLIYSRMA